MGIEQRNAPRVSLNVPFRLITTGLISHTIDGETIDVSERGLGIKFGRGKVPAIDSVMEDLVEDRLPVEITLRLPEGSISVKGHVVWWGLLGDDERFALRAGILLSTDWNEGDWKRIEDSIAARP